MAKETKNEGTEVVAEALSKTELFIKQYGKWMAYTLIALILVGVAVFCWYKFAWQPKKAEALEQMYPAEANFRNSEYDLALNGDGNVLGFAQIIDEYGSIHSTKDGVTVAKSIVLSDPFENLGANAVKEVA